MAKRTNNSYRDLLVDMIKDSGYELVERADDLLAEDLDAICDVDIAIELHSNSFPVIKVSTTMVNKKACDVYTGRARQSVMNDLIDDLKNAKDEQENAHKYCEALENDASKAMDRYKSK